MPNYCNLHGKGDLFILDIFIHVTILLLVLFALFWFVISRLETNEMNKQLQSAINDNLPKVYKQIDQQGELTSLVKGMKNTKTLDAMKNMYSKPDPETKEWNDALWRDNIIIIISFVLGFLAIWGVMVWSCGKCPPVGTLLLENIILFTLVGVVEGLFFYLIAMHYSPVMPSYMTKTVVESLEKNLSGVPTS